MLSLVHVGHNYWHPIIATSFSQLWVFSYNAWRVWKTPEKRSETIFFIKRYLQILQIHSSMLVLLLFGSPHTFSVGFNNCGGQHSLEKDIYLIMKEVGRVEVAWAYCVFCLCVRVCVRVTLTWKTSGASNQGTEFGFAFPRKLGFFSPSCSGTEKSLLPTFSCFTSIIGLNFLSETSKG